MWFIPVTSIHPEFGAPGGRLSACPPRPLYRPLALAGQATDAASTPAAPRFRPRSKPEVLSPAGGWPQLRAAVENGADAVYFGLSDGLNARARAASFDPDELPVLMAYLRDRGVKGYATLNVLVFDSELPSVQKRAREMAAAGVDAVIVQDVGAAELLRRAAPGLPLHGSTQMSITSAEGAEFAFQVRGVCRRIEVVVLFSYGLQRYGRH